MMMNISETRFNGLHFVAHCKCLAPFCLAWWAWKVGRSRKKCEKRHLTWIQGHRFCHQSKEHMRLFISGQ